MHNDESTQSEQPLTFLIHVSSREIHSAQPFRMSEILVALTPAAVEAACQQRKIDAASLTDIQQLGLRHQLAADSVLDFLHVKYHDGSQVIHDFTRSVTNAPSQILDRVPPSHTFEHSRVWVLKETKPTDTSANVA